MLHLFFTPSPLLVGGEVLVGMSLPMFVAALIVAFGDRIKLSGTRLGAGRLARGGPACLVQGRGGPAHRVPHDDTAA
jgi:hypothetical protein